MHWVAALGSGIRFEEISGISLTTARLLVSMPGCTIVLRDRQGLIPGMRFKIGGQPPEAPPTAVTPRDYKNSSGSDLEEMDHFRRFVGLPSILIMARG